MGRLSALRRLVRPARQAAAGFSLVVEERNQRVAREKELLEQVEQRLQQVLDTDMRPLWTQFEQRIAEYDRTLLPRVDLALTELWRRAEAASANNAAALQRLAGDVAQLKRENAALLRRLEPPEAFTGDIDAELLERYKPFRLNLRMLFDEVERGSRSDVLAKIAKYMPYFLGREPVVDLGSGQGEFLEMARTAGISAYGVDLVEESVERARLLGLDARVGDIFAHLQELPEASLGGVFSSQVVEHLPPDSIPVLLAAIARALKPGAPVILETPNPASFATHVNSFWRDPTHTRPVPPQSLSYAARAAGLVVEDVLFAIPPADADRLEPVPLPGPGAAPELRLQADRFNHAVRLLNDVIFGPMDYALVARRPQ